MVEHLVWDQGVAGSNPVFPTIFMAGYLSWLENSAHTRGVVGSVVIMTYQIHQKLMYTELVELVELKAKVLHSQFLQLMIKAKLLISKQLLGKVLHALI